MSTGTWAGWIGHELYLKTRAGHHPRLVIQYAAENILRNQWQTRLFWGGAGLRVTVCIRVRGSIRDRSLLRGCVTVSVSRFDVLFGSCAYSPSHLHVSMLGRTIPLGPRPICHKRLFPCKLPSWYRTEQWDVSNQRHDGQVSHVVSLDRKGGELSSFDKGACAGPPYM